MKMPLLIAISWSSMAAFFNTYVFDDWSFLIYLVIMIFIDTVLGIWKAWKYHVLSSSRFGGMIIKSVLYAFFLIKLLYIKFLCTLKPTAPASWLNFANCLKYIVRLENGPTLFNISFLIS